MRFGNQISKSKRIGSPPFRKSRVEGFAPNRLMSELAQSVSSTALHMHKGLSSKRVALPSQVSNDRRPGPPPLPHSPPTFSLACTRQSLSRSRLLTERTSCLSAMVDEAKEIMTLVTQAKRYAANLALNKKKTGPQNIVTWPVGQQLSKPPALSLSSALCPCNVVHDTPTPTASIQITWRQPNHRAAKIEVYCDRESWSIGHRMIPDPHQIGVWSTRLIAEIDAPLMFKFVVDGKWVVSSDFGVAVDGNNVNNIAVPKLMKVRLPLGVQDVVMRTSFDGWGVEHPMKRCFVTQQHQLAVLLPYGYHEFKFVCKGKWIVSDQHSHTASGPFQNNFVHV
eukprot:c53633_g1_i1.p1 GENE.c53633_g1_i1~~c53633_g1_i1.p1  ORF type:complete len:337 (-),score=57.61 c53633_g1_i1:11-1021(-)